MATHDYNLANQDGASFRSDLNNALAAIVSNNSSSTAPATTFAHQIWVDTTANVIKQRNAANDAWIELWRIDGGFNAKTFSSNVTLNAQSDLRFADSDSSNWVAFQAPATVASNVTWTLPSADGTADQALTTNGSGVLSWADAGGTTDNITEGNTSAEVVDTGSDGHFKVVTEGTERLRVDNAGRLLAGSNTARTDFFNFGSAYGSRFLSELSGDSDAVRISYAAVRNSNNVDSGFLAFGKSRGTSNGSATIVQSGDALGEITFQGADGSELVPGASIKVEVDGTPGANDMPGRLVFSTTADGASGPTERMRIKSSGQISIDLPSNTTSRHIGITNSAGSIGWTFGNGITASARQFVVYDNEAGAARTVIDSSGNFKFNSGYGSAATAYGVRAWCNFNGDALTITGSGNVSSITDISAGRQSVNFTTAMPDDNYAPVVAGQNGSGGDPYTVGFASVNSTDVEIVRQRANGTYTDGSEFGVAIIR